MTTRPNCRPTNRLPLHSRSAHLDSIHHKARALTFTEFFTAATLGPSTTPCKLRAFSRTESDRHSALSFLASMESRMRRSLRSLRGQVRFQRGRSFTSNRTFIRIVLQTPDLKLRVYDTFRSIATIRGLSKGFNLAGTNNNRTAHTPYGVHYWHFLSPPGHGANRSSRNRHCVCRRLPFSRPVKGNNCRSTGAANCFGGSSNLSTK
jgi:hypothetical protein